ncbi:MAG TPA: trimeric intracellular cation channel family protein [Nitrospirota bacterium]|nr:trimeric intracellular cation channel family protein [Nitrospirota bacterium]
MNTLVKTIEVLGIIAFALTGIYAARKKGMDIIGVYSLAMVTALGGGSLRDVLLNRHPLFWIEHYEYAILLLVLAIVSTAVAQDVFEKKGIVNIVLALDALGLGSFSASGASLADQLGCALFVSSLLGVITGVFGGVMRDVICNEIPYVFQRTELYATCSFVGAWTYLMVVRSSGNDVAAAVACIAATFILRIFALRYKIKLPL